MSRDSRELAGAWRTFQRHAFSSPSPDLARYVEHYWVVSWNYREPYRQLIVPYPNVHLAFQDSGATVHGVSSGHQVKVLEGASGMFGVAFRPGCSARSCMTRSRRSQIAQFTPPRSSGPISKGASIDWASLAARLGYADQAHFSRDFKEMFGEPPTRYAERY